MVSSLQHTAAAAAYTALSGVLTLHSFVAIRRLFLASRSFILYTSLLSFPPPCAPYISYTRSGGGGRAQLLKSELTLPRGGGFNALVYFRCVHKDAHICMRRCRPLEGEPGARNTTHPRVFHSRAAAAVVCAGDARIVSTPTHAKLRKSRIFSVNSLRAQRVIVKFAFFSVPRKCRKFVYYLHGWITRRLVRTSSFGRI